MSKLTRVLKEKQVVGSFAFGGRAILPAAGFQPALAALQNQTDPLPKSSKTGCRHAMHGEHLHEPSYSLLVSACFRDCRLYTIQPMSRPMLRSAAVPGSGTTPPDVSQP
jgi:hypothetical protein